MNLIEDPFIQKITFTIGWTLLHSLWQGALIIIMLGSILKLLKRKTSAISYAVCCVALFLILTTSLFTFVKLNSAQKTNTKEMSFTANTERLPEIAFMSGGGVPEFNDRNLVNTIWSVQKNRLENIFPFLIAGWLLGILFLSGRLILSYLSLKRLRIRAIKMSEAKYEKILEIISQKIGITQPVELLLSETTHVPLVIGWIRPLILLPENITKTLDLQQIESIIAHELAHVRRYDYLINLFQTVIDTLFFYHPAVWWISRRIRVLREYVCDDMVVDICKDKVTYARALRTIEQLRRNPAHNFSMAANGGSLLSRIKRILEPPPVPHSNFVSLILICFVTFATLMTAFGAIAGDSKYSGRRKAPDQLSLEIPVPQSSPSPAAKKETPSAVKLDSKNEDDSEKNLRAKTSLPEADATKELSNAQKSETQSGNGQTSARQQNQEQQEPSSLEKLDQLINIGIKSVDLVKKTESIDPETNTGNKIPQPITPPQPAGQTGTIQNSSPQRRSQNGAFKPNSSALDKLEQLIDLGNKSIDLKIKTDELNKDDKDEKSKPEKKGKSNNKDKDN